MSAFTPAFQVICHLFPQNRHLKSSQTYIRAELFSLTSVFSSRSTFTSLILGLFEGFIFKVSLCSRKLVGTEVEKLLEPCVNISTCSFRSDNFSLKEIILKEDKAFHYYCYKATIFVVSRL